MGHATLLNKKQGQLVEILVAKWFPAPSRLVQSTCRYLFPRKSHCLAVLKAAIKDKKLIYVTCHYYFLIIKQQL